MQGRQRACVVGDVRTKVFVSVSGDVLVMGAFEKLLSNDNAGLYVKMGFKKPRFEPDSNPKSPNFRFKHVMRMAPERPARRAIEWTPADGRRRRGRPKKTWRSTFREDLQAIEVNWSDKDTMAADRVRWRNLLPIVPQGTAGSKC